MHIYFQNMQIQLTDIDVAIIFKATYARFEREKKLFYSFIQNTSKRFIYQKHALDCVHEHIKNQAEKTQPRPEQFEDCVY